LLPFELAVDDSLGGSFLFGGFEQKLGWRLRNDHHTVHIGKYNIARIHEDASALDGYVGIKPVRFPPG